MNRIKRHEHFTHSSNNLVKIHINQTIEIIIPAIINTIIKKEQILFKYINSNSNRIMIWLYCLCRNNRCRN
jgi:hypothetical protein